MNLRDTYNLIAEDYYKDHLEIENWPRKDAKQFAKLFPNNSLILDAGCGPGIKSKDLSEEGVKVLGIDISEKMIEIAKKVAPNCKYKVLDIRDLSLLGKKFDGIFAQACLLHFPKKEIPSIMKIFYDNLKKGGYVYISVKRIGPDGSEEKEKIENDYGYPYKRFFSYFNEEEVRNYIEKSNFKIVKKKTKTLKNFIGDKSWLVFIAQK